jgi:hypothetical protein
MSYPNLTTDVLIGILFFLLYIAVRSSTRAHFIIGIITGLLFVFSGFVISGLDGEILGISGFLLILISIGSRERKKNDE